MFPFKREKARIEILNTWLDIQVKIPILRMSSFCRLIKICKSEVFRFCLSISNI